MNEKNEKNIVSGNDYYVGLDIGTDSVGWAVTDTDYKLLKSGGSPLWGAYLFTQAETAEKRRQFRTSRRRTARVRQRLLLLQSLFRTEIEKVDPTFFIRLNNSALYPEDKDGRIATKYILFGDADYDDKKYFAQFPTVFHLRKYLAENAPQDVRLLYLACHHIIKNRGHFLFENETLNFNGNDIAYSAFNNINLALESDECATAFERNAIDEAMTVLRGKATKSDKQRELCKIFGIDKSDKRALAVIKLITGGVCNASALYGVELADDPKIDMATMDDVKFVQIKEIASDDYLLDGIKAIYDWSVLVNILKDENSISCARVKAYDTHKHDLALLKRFVREKCPKWYDEKKKITFSKFVFRYDPSRKNYAAYIGMDKHKSYGKASKDEFYEFLKKQVFGSVDEFARFVDEIIASGDSREDTRTAVGRFERGEFLPKQISNANGVIPHQLHKQELLSILGKAKEKFAFLSDTDEAGISVAEKIVKLLEFRIPYFVGPLEGERAWAVRKEGMQGVTVTPWNFDDVIDKDASEEKFIKDMTSKCTYVPTEDVLPAGSLLYCEATFLSELNNLKINGVKDERAIDLVYGLAHREKKITKKKILATLKINGYDMADITPDSISGIDGDMKSSLSSYIDFNRILDGEIENHRDMCEQIILWSTLVSDKDRLVKRIKDKYGKVLTDKQIKSIKGLTFTKWGKLSKVLLGEIVSEKLFGESGENLTVIEAMRAYKINLSEALLSKRWGFADAIEKYNREYASGTARSIDDLYCSPAVKRAIRRSLALVKEIVKIQGHAPEKIMIEVARGGSDEQKGMRTKSRKQQLLDLYNSIKTEMRDFAKVITEISEKDERDFASKRLFAYYMQQGICMYSGEKIDINELFDRNVYDFDHIYPRSKINDDSFDNRVLVKKTVNARKSDVYPLPADIRGKMSARWADMHKRGFISDKKYERLMRSTELTPDELADFENRQIVITSQSAKLVAGILRENFPDSEIVYSKASKAAEFKNNFGAYAEKVGCAEKYRTELVKVRELNNLHHAKDAYVNVVVGNVLNTEYGHDATVFYKNKTAAEMRSDYSLFRWGVKGAWDPQKDIPTVFDTYYSDNCKVVRFVKEGGGRLFEATIKTAGANDKLIPLKSKGSISDTGKYGGYDSASTAYFALVKSKGKKGESRLSLEPIPVMIEKLMSKDERSVTRYVAEKCGLTDPQIVIPKIRLSSLLIVDGSPAYIKGKQNASILLDNAAELYLDKARTDYIKKVVAFDKKRAEAAKKNYPISADERYDKITAEQNADIYDTFTQKLGSKLYAGLSMAGQCDALKECREQFVTMPLEKQCEVLCKILLFLNANSVLLDLSDFVDKNGKTRGKSLGKNTMSKFVENKNIKWIVQSPTGRYSQAIDFKKFL